jgi:hypothetical protein
MNFTGIDVNVVENEEELRNLFLNYQKFEEIQSFIILKLGFSSGEEALLNIFSRFYELEENKIEKEDLIILMDEPELYLHPEWQRKLIYMLIEYLEHKDIYKDKNIQIILTSNAPYVLSDMPKDKVHYICNKQCGYFNFISNSYAVNTEQTFGSNIHTLLTKLFFMDSTIGEFAKNKITGIIAELENIRNNIGKCAEKKLNININEENNIYERLKEKNGYVDFTDDNCHNYNEKLKEVVNKVIEEYEPFINIIGEPVTRRVVKNLLDDILYIAKSCKISERKSIEDKIKYHQDMVEELTRKKEGESK